MNRPYKYIIFATPRSMSYWLAEFLGFDHDASATFKDGKWEQKSEGLVDTGIYRFPELLNEMSAVNCRYGWIGRHEDSLAESYRSHFGLSEIQATMLARENYLNFERSLWRGIGGDSAKNGIIKAGFPLRPEDLKPLMEVLAMRYDEEKVKKALDEKKDKLDDPAYRSKCLELLGEIFKLPQQ